MKRRSRTSVNLSESVHKQLSMYALAAGAAGVSLLALAPPSEAKIVYHHVHFVIHPHHSYHLDLNHDGVSDFTLQIRQIVRTWYYENFLSAVPARNNAVVGQKGQKSFYSYASALSGGSWVRSEEALFRHPGGTCRI